MAITLEQFPQLTSPIGLGIVVIGSLVALYLLERHVLSVPYPEGIPLVREPEGARRFSLRTRLAYFVDCEALFRDAYVNVGPYSPWLTTPELTKPQYSKKGKPVVVPGVGFRKEVILPPSSMRWVLAQPESVLDVGAAFAEVDQVHWSLGHDRYVQDPWQGNLVKTELNRTLESICASMNDELQYVCNAQFGTDTENWNEVDLARTVQYIIAQAASRFTVGLPLCKLHSRLHCRLPMLTCS